MPRDSFPDRVMLIRFPEIDTGRSLIISHLQPFGARVDIEIIKTPQPVCADRSKRPRRPYCKGDPTKYIHFIINQVVLEPEPLYDSFGVLTGGVADIATRRKPSGMWQERRWVV